MGISLTTHLNQREATQQQRKLLNWLWVIVAATFLAALIQSQTAEVLSLFGFVCIVFAALLPVYLWCSGRVHGLPIFPIFAALFITSDALPLISNYYFVREYSPWAHFFAGITVAMVLLVATAVWANFTGTPGKAPKVIRAFDSKKSEPAFWVFMVMGVLSNLTAPYLTSYAGGVQTSAQGFALGMSALATFVLAYRMGSGEWENNKKIAFVFLLIANIIISSAGLLLIDSMTRFGLAIVGYVMRSRKIPFVPLALGLIMFSILHYGKGSMRDRHWLGEARVVVNVTQYAGWYVQWIGDSFTQIQKTISGTSDEEVLVQSPMMRSSEIHLLLLVQDRTPQAVPYLYGSTYTLIPSLLVPRLLNPNKPQVHAGTTMLNLHYGIQTSEEAASTTIHIGLIAEAYANFGLLGCVGLGLFMGMLFGVITRLSTNVPITSARGLAAIVLLSVAITTQASMGVLISSLNQAMIAMLIVAWVFMKSQRTTDVYS